MIDMNNMTITFDLTKLKEAKDLIHSDEFISLLLNQSTDIDVPALILTILENEFTKLEKEFNKDE